MKKYSYNLFPKPFVVLGYLLILYAFALVLMNLTSMKSENHFNDFATSFTIIFIGLIIILFKSKLIIDDKSRFVLKESSLVGMILSRDKVKIPNNCTGILIIEKIKKGTGYYKFILPISYYFKSFDMFFQSETGLVRLVNTDYKRAIKIAEFLKSITNLEYILKKQTNQSIRTIK